MSRIRVPFASQIGSLLRLRRHVVLVLLVAAMLAPAALTSSVATAQGYCATAEEMDMLARINALRQANGLQPYTLSAPLGAAARMKSTDMADNNYFAHTSPSGVTARDLLDRVGYPRTNVAWGENIAAGNASASGTFTQWSNSTPHRNSMLSTRFTAIGIARADNASSRYRFYWTTEFGSQVVQPAVACGNGGSVSTATSVPPTATATRPPVTATSVPPTATATRPPATATSVPPTATRPPATATSIPPTATRPPATATSVPPTATAIATVPPSATPKPTRTPRPSPTPRPTRTPRADAVPAQTVVFAVGGTIVTISG